MSPQDTLVHSYLFLRRAIGTIGTALPVVLILGKWLIEGGGTLYSISDYYYSDLRGVFVGSMCAIGVFLLSYRGYGPIDDFAGNLAAVCAVGVALFPTTPVNATPTEQVVGTLHLVFAGGFFLTLAFFCLVLFRRSDSATPTQRKVWRNRVYLVTGSVILVCLVLIAVVTRFPVPELVALHPPLWLETAAILAFGLAWLTKGEAILADLTPAPALTAVHNPA